MKQLLITSLIILSATFISNGQCYEKRPTNNQTGNTWENRWDNFKDNCKEQKNRRNEMDSPQKAIYLEWRGNGIGKSLNFDTRFSNGRNGLGLRE